jgi:gamma-glutamylcyclotransferase (GGCT)/AIG2-like uncharacterized protein YtfP
MKKNLFTYGSLILEKSPVRVIPIESVFVRGCKLVTKNKENSRYVFLLLEPTGTLEDIVSGYLAEVTDEELEKIDRYEGVQYQRRELIAYKRDGTHLKAFAYFRYN